jgi:hypothetical protein
MYRLVTWRLPPSSLTSTDGLAMDAKMFKSLLKPVRECNAQAPPALCNLIHHCLEFNAAKRPERMSEVQGALDHMADELVRTPEDGLEAQEW